MPAHHHPAPSICTMPALLTQAELRGVPMISFYEITFLQLGASYRKATWFMETGGGPVTQGQSLRPRDISRLVEIEAPRVAMGQIRRAPRDSYPRLWPPETPGSRDIPSGSPTPHPAQMESHLPDRAFSLILLS